MVTSADPAPVSPLYDILDKSLREVKVRLIAVRIERGNYNEQAAMPTVVDRIMKELHDGKD